MALTLNENHRLKIVIKYLRAWHGDAWALEWGGIQVGLCRRSSRCLNKEGIRRRTCMHGRRHAFQCHVNFSTTTDGQYY
jgi:hypothetical protein